MAHKESIGLGGEFRRLLSDARSTAEDAADLDRLVGDRMMDAAKDIVAASKHVEAIHRPASDPDWTADQRQQIGLVCRQAMESLDEARTKFWDVFDDIFRLLEARRAAQGGPADLL